jgi:hypothetical protein
VQREPPGGGRLFREHRDSPLTAGFSAEEWSVVAEAPLLAGARVAAAERGGTLRERFEIHRVYAAARELHGQSALLDELVASSPSMGRRQMREYGDAVTVSNERLRAALAVLEAKASQADVAAYKGFVLAVVQTAAEAHRDGGFVGIGGAEVSEREQAALDEIGAILGQ